MLYVILNKRKHARNIELLALDRQQCVAFVLVRISLLTCGFGWWVPLIVSGVGGGGVIEREGGSLAPAGRGGKRRGEKVRKRDTRSSIL